MPVKTRSYNSPRRREQADATRRRILEAAERLFGEHGYGATTMAAIAAEAEVALKTVYVAFETKSGVLRGLWNLRLRGDADEAPMPERAWYREVLEEEDPGEQLRMTARNSRMVKERIGPTLEAIRSGAPVDPEIAALWERIGKEFHRVLRGVVESLASKKALRRGLDPERAADILWTISHPDLWRLLVGERGWSPEDYERWCADASIADLLKARSGRTSAVRG